MSEKSVPIDELAKKVTAIGLGVANSLHAIGWFTLSQPHNCPFMVRIIVLRNNSLEPDV